MIINDLILNNARRGMRAFTLVEVLISIGILAFMMVSLYASFAFGFASLETTREDLRATQLLMQKGGSGPALHLGAIIQLPDHILGQL